MAESDYKVFFHSPINLFCIASFDGYFQDLSPLWTSLLGYSMEEFLERPYLSFVHPDDRERTLAEAQRLMQGLLTRDFKNRYITQSGAIRWFQWTSVPNIRDRIVYAVAADITDQEKCRTLLEETNSVARIGGWELSCLDQSLYWTRGTYHVFEVATQDYAPRLESMMEFFSVESRALFRRALRDAQQTGVAFDLELRIVTEKRNSRWVRIIGNVNRDQGQIVRLYGTIQDVTDQKSREMALIESELRLLRVVDSAMDAVITIDNENRIVVFNRAAETTFGYSASEVLGQKLDMLFPQSADISFDIGADFARLCRCRQGLRKNGEEFPLEISVSVVTSSGRKIVTAIVRDISERLRGQETERRLLEQLEQARRLESLGTLAGGIAHDFNNIMSAIVGFAERARQKIDHPELAEGELRQVLSAIERGREMVERVFAFTRHETQEWKQVELNGILNEVIQMLQATLWNTVQIEFRCEPSCIIWGDSLQLFQTFANLLKNAVDALGKGGGKIEIDVSRRYFPVPPQSIHIDLHAGEYMQVKIRDNGPGIPTSALSHIFDPFFTTKRAGEGTGLGLSVVHSVVREHGGVVLVESTPHVGTVFSVYLPVGSELRPHALRPLKTRIHSSAILYEGGSHDGLEKGESSHLSKLPEDNRVPEQISKTYS